MIQGFKPGNPILLLKPVQGGEHGVGVPLYSLPPPIYQGYFSRFLDIVNNKMFTAVTQLLTVDVLYEAENGR